MSDFSPAPFIALTIDGRRFDGVMQVRVDGLTTEIEGETPLEETLNALRAMTGADVIAEIVVQGVARAFVGVARFSFAGEIREEETHRVLHRLTREEIDDLNREGFPLGLIPLTEIRPVARPVYGWRLTIRTARRHCDPRLGLEAE